MAKSYKYYRYVKDVGGVGRVSNEGKAQNRKQGETAWYNLGDYSENTFTGVVSCSYAEAMKILGIPVKSKKASVRIYGPSYAMGDYRLYPNKIIFSSSHQTWGERTIFSETDDTIGPRLTDKQAKEFLKQHPLPVEQKIVKPDNVISVPESVVNEPIVVKTVPVKEGELKVGDKVKYVNDGFNLDLGPIPGCKKGEIYTITEVHDSGDVYISGDTSKDHRYYGRFEKVVASEKKDEIPSLPLPSTEKPWQCPHCGTKLTVGIGRFEYASRC